MTEIITINKFRTSWQLKSELSCLIRSRKESNTSLHSLEFIFESLECILSSIALSKNSCNFVKRILVLARAPCGSSNRKKGRKSGTLGLPVSLVRPTIVSLKSQDLSLEAL